MDAYRRFLAIVLFCGFSLSASCGGGGGKPGDADQDGISDIDEGNVDTDGDGLVDSLDPDSDNDGLPDSFEAGDEDPETPPPDSDGDGIPNFQDTDSDNNGIPDADDIFDVDTDGDGILDGYDFDDDGDNIQDVFELEDGELVDTDGDNIPDIRDEDSDGDTLSDLFEGLGDADGDGIPNFREIDSDGDGIPDGVEGIEDVDDDGFSNFTDLDSDNDGLSDALERQLGTSPVNADTDGDGFGDLEEQVIHEQCLLSPQTCNGDPDPLNPNVGISPNDFVFILPFEAPPQEGNLSFVTDISVADIHFNVDTTSSMGQEIDNLKAGLQTIIQQVSDPVEGIPDTAFGVSSFEDFPVFPYGGAGDLPFRLLQRITTDPAEAQSGVDALVVRDGGDIPESGNEALFQIATGAGLGGFLAPFSPGVGFDPAKNGFLGGVGFRAGAFPVVIQVTDALAHSTDNPLNLLCQNGISASLQYGQNGLPSIFGTRSRSEVISALGALGVRVIGIASNEQPVGTICSPRGDLEELAEATGAVVTPEAFTDANGNRPVGCAPDQCCTAVNGAGRPAVGGLCPLVFDVNADGSGEFTGEVIRAIQALTRFAVLDVSTTPKSQNQPDANGNLIDPADFIKEILAVDLSPTPAGGVQIDPVTQTFLDVQPGTIATFALTAENDFLPQAPTVQVFTLQIDVLGDAVTVLDTRQVVIIVPARIENLEL